MVKAKEKEFVIVRAKDAGVHCGVLEESDGARVTLSDARNVWRWRGANSLGEMANSGCSKDYTRISEPVTKKVIANYCEILWCTEKARKDLQNSRWAP